MTRRPLIAVHSRAGIITLSARQAAAAVGAAVPIGALIALALGVTP